MLELLGRAGCVSIEAGVESLTAEGREQLAKNCQLSDRGAGRAADLRQAARAVRAGQPDRDAARRPGRWSDWRERLRAARRLGQRSGAAVSLPGSPDYRRLWGEPDDAAWERAHEHYLGQFDSVQRHPGGAVRCALDRVGGGVRARMTADLAAGSS